MTRQLTRYGSFLDLHSQHSLLPAAFEFLVPKRDPEFDEAEAVAEEAPWTADRWRGRIHELVADDALQDLPPLQRELVAKRAWSAVKGACEKYVRRNAPWAKLWTPFTSALFASPYALSPAELWELLPRWVERGADELREWNGGREQRAAALKEADAIETELANAREFVARRFDSSVDADDVVQQAALEALIRNRRRAFRGPSLEIAYYRALNEKTRRSPRAEAPDETPAVFDLVGAISASALEAAPHLLGPDMILKLAEDAIEGRGDVPLLTLVRLVGPEPILELARRPDHLIQVVGLLQAQGVSNKQIRAMLRIGHQRLKALG